MYTAPNYNIISSQVSDLAATISIEQHQVQFLRQRMTSSFGSIRALYSTMCLEENVFSVFFYNLKLLEPICVIFGIHYPDNPNC